jgi:hypothetical protein
MKDSVKITVIATGFKDADVIRRRKEASRTPIITSRPERREFFDDPEAEPTPEPIVEPLIMQEAGDSVAQAPQPAPVEQVAAMMTPNFQPDDLDVPAFMRKRTDVM